MDFTSLENVGSLALAQGAMTAEQAAKNSGKGSINPASELNKEIQKEFPFFTEMKNFAELIKKMFGPEIDALLSDFTKLGGAMLGIDSKDLKQMLNTPNSKVANASNDASNDATPSPSR